MGSRVYNRVFDESVVERVVAYKRPRDSLNDAYYNNNSIIICGALKTISARRLRGFRSVDFH